MMPSSGGLFASKSSKSGDWRRMRASLTDPGHFAMILMKSRSASLVSEVTGLCDYCSDEYLVAIFQKNTLGLYACS